MKILNDVDLKLDICDTMDKYGGSFVKALSGCIRVADDVNLSKIETLFSNYLEQYKSMIKK